MWNDALLLTGRPRALPRSRRRPSRQASPEAPRTLASKGLPRPEEPTTDHIESAGNHFVVRPTTCGARRRSAISVSVFRMMRRRPTYGIRNERQGPMLHAFLDLINAALPPHRTEFVESGDSVDVILALIDEPLGLQRRASVDDAAEPGVIRLFFVKNDYIDAEEWSAVNMVTRLGDTTEWRSVTAFSDEATRTLRELFDLAVGRVAVQRGWWASAETLIGQLARLLEERETLETQLASALRDRDVACAKVDQLQAMYDVLYSERYRTKGWTRPDVLAQFAIAVATLLGPLTAVVVGSRVEESVQAAIEAANVVEVECSDVDVQVNVRDASRS